MSETPDGITVSYSHELTPGSGETVGTVWVDEESDQQVSPSNERWGESYALSTEIFQFFYEGRALAAGNIYNGQRITQVCMIYKRDGEPLTDLTCSDAIHNGSTWMPGEIKTLKAHDSPNSDAPKTTFHYHYNAIDPSIF